MLRRESAVRSAFALHKAVLDTERRADLFALHSVTPTSLEAFIVRIYRKANRVSRLDLLCCPPWLTSTPRQTGFLKAFSDQPEQFTFGLSPLQTVLMQLKLREVIICPR